MRSASPAMLSPEWTNRIYKRYIHAIAECY